MVRSLVLLSVLGSLFVAGLSGCSSTSSKPYALTGESKETRNPATYAAKDRIWLGAQTR
jgi:uncharacterized protein YceK